MAQPVMYEENRVGVDQSNYPNHFIIWLDQHIGKPEECVLLKCSLFLAIDPTTGLFERNLNKDDIDRSIRLDACLLVRLDEVEFIFQPFVDVEKCFKTIEKNRRDKRIFLITSGSKGKIIIPSLMTNFPETFVPNYRMYIFCANMIMTPVAGSEAPTNTWALEYLENILMLDHQDDLFSRMVSDIADYFFRKAQTLNNAEHPDSVRQYLIWSKKMFQRYEKLEPIRKTTEIQEIDRLINDIEQQRNPFMNADNDHISESCS